QVPLPSVLGATRMEGEVTLHLMGADLVQVETTGLREAPPITRTGGQAQGLQPVSTTSQGWRTFRYGSGVVALALQGQTPTTDRSGERVDGARLTTYVG